MNTRNVCAQCWRRTWSGCRWASSSKSTRPNRLVRCTTTSSSPNFGPATRSTPNCMPWRASAATTPSSRLLVRSLDAYLFKISLFEHKLSFQWYVDGNLLNWNVTKDSVLMDYQFYYFFNRLVGWKLIHFFLAAFCFLAWTALEVGTRLGIRYCMFLLNSYLLGGKSIDSLVATT